MLSSLPAIWVAAKKMLPDPENPQCRNIYLPSIYTILTIARTFDTPFPWLPPNSNTVDDISALLTIVYSTEILISTTQSLTTVENLQCNVIPAGCRNESLQILIQLFCRLYNSESGPRTLVLESFKRVQTHGEVGRNRVAYYHNRLIIRWGSTSGSLSCPLSSYSSKAPAPTNRIS
jgi:hypothetical protein